LTVPFCRRCRLFTVPERYPKNSAEPCSLRDSVTTFILSCAIACACEENQRARLALRFARWVAYEQSHSGRESEASPAEGVARVQDSQTCRLLFYSHLAQAELLKPEPRCYGYLYQHAPMPKSRLWSMCTWMSRIAGSPGSDASSDVSRRLANLVEGSERDILDSPARRNPLRHRPSSTNIHALTTIPSAQYGYGECIHPPPRHLPS
jgi:hypothetical protein